MSEDPKIHIRIDSANKRKDLPECGDHDHCPTCGGELEQGFGLAGGGFGVYTYCTECERVTSKTEIEE